MASGARELHVGSWRAFVADGAIRRISWEGIEVIRGISSPVRDPNWGCYPQDTLSSSWDAHTGRYVWSFQLEGQEADGELMLTFGTTGTLAATFVLRTCGDLRTNRAGLVVLHPLDGVAGQPMLIKHADGSTTRSCFPFHVSPSQPAQEVIGIEHTVNGMRVALDFEGDIFEMEDQRNWLDASYKTYCRPLKLPYPYTIPSGSVVRQALHVSVCRAQDDPSRDPVLRTASGRTAPKPELLIAAESGWSARVSHAPEQRLLVRLHTLDDSLALWIKRACAGRDIDVEIVIPHHVDPQRYLDEIAENLSQQGVNVRHAFALPAAYLKSYQPEGPWPDGLTPEEAVAAARRAFPMAKIGVGVMTNFAELNRLPVNLSVGDYVTFSTTAIVHAADDESVWETLESIPYVFDSATKLAAGRPIRLGLTCIGMRTNPYGDALAEPREGMMVPMAENDPRQGTSFAADYARKVIEIAHLAGIEALAICSLGGPFAPSPELWDRLGAQKN